MDHWNENILSGGSLYANILSFQHDNGTHMDGFPMLYLFCGRNMCLCSLGKMTRLEYDESLCVKIECYFL